MSGTVNKKHSIVHVLEPFRFADLQTFKNIIITLQMYEFTIEDVLRHIIEKEHSLSHVNLPKRVCVCGSDMLLYRVNTSNCSQVDDGSKSQWFCPECWESEFVKETIEELVEKENEDGI